MTSTSHPTFIWLFNVNLRTPFSLTELSFLDITLHITNEHISISIHEKDPDTHTYLHHSSSYPRHCKKGLPHSQLLRLHRLCSNDSNSLEKGTEMIFFLNNVATQCNVIFMPSDGSTVLKFLIIVGPPITVWTGFPPHVKWKNHENPAAQFHHLDGPSGHYSIFSTATAGSLSPRRKPPRHPGAHS